MKSCPNCRAVCDDFAVNCPSCGAPLPVVNAAPSYGANVPEPNVLVWGILSLVFSCTFYFAFLGIIFGAIGLSKAKGYVAQGGVLAGKVKVGRILSLVGLILSIVFTVLALFAIIGIIAANS